MHSSVQTAAVTIVRYKLLSDLNFAIVGTQNTIWQLHTLFPFGVYNSAAKNSDFVLILGFLNVKIT